MKENKASRKYKFWDKWFSKYERELEELGYKKTGYPTYISPRTHITKLDKLTPEERAELLKRLDDMEAIVKAKLKKIRKAN